MKTFQPYALLALVLAASPVFAASDAEDFERGFGSSSGISEAEKSSADKDRLKIGGTLATDLYVFGTGSRDYLRNLNTLWLYLDAQLREDVRAYVKGRGVVETTRATAASSVVPASRSDVEEMKLMLNWNKRAFFTVGKQKIKWGVGKFWNPTDVINTTRRDLLYSDDRRSGVNILKTHVPLGAANFYLVNSFQGAERLNQVGNAVRVEVPWRSSEFSLTASKQSGQHPVFGADLSVGIWDLDLHGEASFSNGSNQTFYGPTGAFTKPDQKTFNWVTGLSYEFKYNDVDTLTLIVEYFRNGDGYAKADYLWPIASSAYVPFYLAKQYAMAMVYLPNPGSWNHTTFSLFNLLNLEDGSALTKLTASFSVLQDLTWTVGANFNYGNADGELRLGDQRYGAETRLQVDF